MPKKYEKEELWKLYDKLPEELKSAVFAEDTANSIREICVRNEIVDERAGKIAEYTGFVLLGILPPEDFQQELEKELSLEKEQAKKVAQEIYRLVFFPIKGLLDELYGVKTEKKPAQKPETAVKEEKIVEKPAERRGPDTYREAVE